MKKLSINVRIAIFIGLFISFVSSLLFGFKYLDNFLMDVWFWSSTICLVVSIFMFMPIPSDVEKS